MSEGSAASELDKANVIIQDSTIRLLNEEYLRSTEAAVQRVFESAIQLSGLTLSDGDLDSVCSSAAKAFHSTYVAQK